ncbi:MAG: SDR family NAD(P)-dependent oxidoreductase [Verrucomicrobiota bacterium]|nr:SDR family NAD(P)-dependent oxidoreductase [Verrucomicrobiota bacterium]HAA88162.1 3-oxoacyl-ACP reductase [Verrucomicrobiales bacterium]
MNPNFNRYDGRVAIVTGGADGIGKAISIRLATEGAKVCLFDKDIELLERTAKEVPGSSSYQVDISDDSAVSAAFNEVINTEDKVDVVVNCAGIVGPNAKKINEVEVDDFDRVYAVNLRGSFSVTKYALRHMEKQNYGRILLFASIAGKEGNAGMTAYSATKAGVLGLTKSAAKDFAETGITINTIAPAVIRTAMVDALDQWQVDYMTEKIPMKRCGTLEEVTSLACWIVSEEASFNTGAVFDLSGGRATY